MVDFISFNPSNPDDDRDSQDPKVTGLDGDEVDDFLDAISSLVAWTILASLHESSATPPNLVAEIDTSLQNVQYRLGSLSKMDLIEVADTRYSKKGCEMDVCTPAGRVLVIVTGRKDETRGLKDAFARPIGGVGILGIGAAVVNRLARTRPMFPLGLGGLTGDVSDSGVGQSGGPGAGLNATRTADSTNVTPAVAETAPTLMRAATETATIDSGSGFSIAETTATADPMAQIAEVTRTMVESMPTVTGAAQTVTEIVTAVPTQTPAPDTTIAQTVTETAMWVTPGSGGSAEVTGTLLSRTLPFLGGLTMLLAWVAVDALCD